MRRLVHRLRRFLAANEAVRRRTRGTVLVVVGAAAIGGIALDVAVPSASAWFGSHQFASALIAEVILLGAVYVGIDYLITRSEERRWRVAAARPLMLMANTAERLDRAIETMISADRRTIDLSSSHYSRAVNERKRFKKLLDEHSALLTASTFMVDFLPVCILLDTHARYVLQDWPNSSDRTLHVQWYDRAVWDFIAKIVDGVHIREISDPWLLRIPERAYRQQLKWTFDDDDREFLLEHLARRRGRDLQPPPESPG